MRSTDPARLTAAERFAELAELLAAGFQRLVAAGCKAIDESIEESMNSRDHLDVLGDSMASCGSDVSNPKSMEPAA